MYIVLQDVIIGGNWLKMTWELSVLLLKTAYKSIIISVKSLILKKYKGKAGIPEGYN